MSKKILVVLLAIAMVLQLFGCGKNEKTNEVLNTPEQEKGRYVEKEIAIPDELKEGYIFQIDKADGGIILYSINTKDGMNTFSCYLYKDGEFKLHTPAWLESIAIEDEKLYAYGTMKIIDNAAGNSYLYCSMQQEESPIGHLFCSKDGVNVVDATPADWLVAANEEYTYYETPTDIGVLDNGTVIAAFYTGNRIYDGNNSDEDALKLLQSPASETRHGEKIYVSKNEYYQSLSDDMMSFKGIEKHDANHKVINTISSTEVNVGSFYMDLMSDGTIIFACEKGIYKVDSEGNWKQLVNGIYTSFAAGDCWCLQLAALDNDVYYGLFTMESGEPKLFEYTYDAEISNQPDVTLNVYSLYDNTSLKLAAASYTKANPGILVNVEIAISDNNTENPDPEDALKSFNTRLIAGEASDIIVLDGMKKESLIDKGILADISDILNPMITDGTLLPNIMKNYVNGTNPAYSVPTRFSINFLLGSKVDVTNSGTVEGLAALCAANRESILGNRTISDLTGQIVPYMVNNLVKDKQLDKEALKKGLEYLKTIADNCGIVADYGENYRAPGAWELASETSIALEEAKGFIDCMFPVGVKNFVKGSMTSFENAFTPICEVGINKSSQNVEEAKKFLQYLLSFDIQNVDNYDGFAVNKAALENQINSDRSGWGFETDIAVGNGQYELFTAGSLTQKEFEDILTMCETVDKPIVYDTQILKVISEELPKYLHGDLSLDDTVTQIEKSLNMYLAE